MPNYCPRTAHSEAKSKRASKDLDRGREEDGEREEKDGGTE